MITTTPADARMASDLADAPESARNALAKERDRLAELDAKARTAAHRVEDTRGRVVDSRAAGTADAGAERAWETARRQAREASDAVDEQRAILDELERRLVDGVRSRRAAEAEADAEQVRARYDAALAQLRAAISLVPSMVEARQDEQRALGVVAVARRQDTIAPGSIPEEITKLAIDIDDNSGRNQRLSPDEVLVRLVRRVTS